MTSQAPADQQAPSDDNGSTSAPRSDSGEPREKRSRERYGRERGPRGEREERPDLRIPAQSMAPQTDAAEPVPATAMPAPEPRVIEPVASAPAPVAAVVATAVAPAGTGMPKVTSFELPIDALLNVAQGSGLQWVNSDPQKIAAIQAAIAGEPKPIHVPRERPAPVAMDTGPLVLVETRRDLRDMTLPFEQPPAA